MDATRKLSLAAAKSPEAHAWWPIVDSSVLARAETLEAGFGVDLSMFLALRPRTRDWTVVAAVSYLAAGLAMPFPTERRVILSGESAMSDVSCSKSKGGNWSSKRESG